MPRSSPSQPLAPFPATETESRPLADGPRYLSIAHDLQARILSGEFPAESQLPPEGALARRFGVARMTIRNAIGLLEKKSLLRRRHGLGTFVCAPSAGRTVGLLFSATLADESAYFYRAALQTFQEEFTRRRWAFRTYENISTESLENLADKPEYQQFEMDRRNYSFHGLVEFGLYHPLPMESKGLHLPRVRFGNHSIPNLDFHFDSYHFGRSIVSFLAQQHGCRKIAYFRSGIGGGVSVSARDVAGVQDEASHLGLPEPMLGNILSKGTIPTGGEEIYQTSRQLIRAWGKQRPDALIVHDDIAMRAVAMALIAERISIPDDLLVATAGNDRGPLSYGFPIIRYLYPLRPAVELLLERLEYRMQGEATVYPPQNIPGTICAPADQQPSPLAPLQPA